MQPHQNYRFLISCYNEYLSGCCKTRRGFLIGLAAENLYLGDAKLSKNLYKN